MPRWFRSDLRRKACIAVAMLYALSVFVPSLAHALSNCAMEFFTVSDHDSGPEATPHHAAVLHHAIAEHPASHGKHGDEDNAPKCCAQMALTILPNENHNPAFTGLSYSPDFPALVARLTGRGAERLDRPPNV